MKYNQQRQIIFDKSWDYGTAEQNFTISDNIILNRRVSKDNKNSPIYARSNDFYLGSIWLTNEGYYVKIVSINNTKDLFIEFLYNGLVIHSTIGALETGSIKNPYKQNKYGCWFGYGPYTKDSSKEHLRLYTVWRNMLERVFNPARNIRDKSYEVELDCRWFDYQLFAYWMDNYLNKLNSEYYFDYQIDKDILQFNIPHKIYSPETCALMPSKLNLALVGTENHVDKQSGLPYGVDKYNESGFVISKFDDKACNTVYQDPMEAFKSYKDIKETHIKDLAKYYLSINAILPEVYAAIENIDIKPF